MWSTLFLRRWIRWHVSNSAKLPDLIPHVILCFGIIYDHWSTSSLILNRQINRHITNSAERLGLIYHASLGSGVIHDHWCDIPLSCRRQIKWHVLDSIDLYYFNKHATSYGGVYTDRGSLRAESTAVDLCILLNARTYFIFLTPLREWR